MNKSYTFNDYISMINSQLDSFIPECTYGEPVVCDAMKYSLGIGGKRIRPVLLLEFCRVCGGDVKKAIPFAVALEMIHTYSLIHDDLPCMDDDDMRRGKPSCHIKYGEEYALLAGDGLLTRAFGVIAQSDAAKENPLCGIKAIAVLSDLAGVEGMIGGQTVDLKNEGRKASLETLEIMDSLKTGALIVCAAELGCIVAGADDEKATAAVTFCKKIGHAFQIVDDILDVIGDETELGKPIGSDGESSKSTYVSILGLEKSREYADRLTREAVEALEIFGDEANLLKEIAGMLINRRN
ncbi:MAG: polyprenyl synthetase family protein [Ruminococcaceae bacterium]|nr:polyprenyl synthetase family protein [Oscillospiraceae bacterium]